LSVFRTRFAPSPTYYLHLGHAASALHVWRAAETASGEVFLRIEDIDTTRCKPEYTAAVLEDLRWLGLEWVEPVRIQSEHFGAYKDCVQSLRERGLAYRCFRSRKELATLANPLQPGPHAPDAERSLLGAGAPFSWRLSLSEARIVLGVKWEMLTYRVQVGGAVHSVRAEPERHGDIVIARKDSPSAYHLAATYDDALQSMTHIIRGEDLVDAPHIQTLLQVLLDWPHPIYQHHPLVTDLGGKKLSKSEQSISLASLRASGMSSEQIRNRLGFA